MLLGQQRVGQVAEEELEEPSDAVDVVEEVFGVAEVEVEVGRVYADCQFSCLEHVGRGDGPVSN